MSLSWDIVFFLAFELELKHWLLLGLKPADIHTEVYHGLPRVSSLLPVDVGTCGYHNHMGHNLLYKFLFVFGSLSLEKPD